MFEGSAFALGLTAPDSGDLAGLQSPFQAGFRNLASTADCLGLFGLKKSRGGVAVGEEQLGVLTPTGSAVTPGDQCGTPFKVGREMCSMMAASALLSTVSCSPVRRLRTRSECCVHQPRTR